MNKDFNIHEAAFDISSFAIQSMLYEVACAPSPGLVSVISMGAHKDMDHYTFIDSTCALIKYLTLCVEEGFSSKDSRELLKCIRPIGIDGEKQMFEKTSGVNTHKGMLFLMGISCVATGKAIYDKRQFKDIPQIIKDMCEGLVEKELYPLKEEIKKYGSLEELSKKRRLSYGEKLYLMYNTEGIRGEVERGLPIIFEFALNFYKENSCLTQNDRLVNTLLGIMQYSEDSNVLHRHSKEILSEVQEKARYIIGIGGMNTVEGRQAIKDLDIDFSNRRISPGGSADLLAVTVFFSLVKEYFSTMNLE